ncbi:hypothetical protein, partial [Actinobacillus pleuropneumoniae]
PKGSAKRATINPNARAAQNYSIVEDLGQSPCAMSALEVLQSVRLREVLYSPQLEQSIQLTL